jgi:glycosyltransferase involved in cell wall biosynthesis
VKVLVITRIYPSSSEPTVGPYNHQIVRAVSQFAEVRVLSPRPWWTRAHPHPLSTLLTPPAEVLDGVPVAYPAYWALPRFALRKSDTLLYRSLKRHVARIHREFPFDVVFAAWSFPDAAAAGMVARDYGCPLVTRTMGSDVNVLGQDPIMKEGVREALLESTRVITVSGALKERVVDLGIPSERVVVRHNGVDGALFQPRDRTEVRRALGLPEDRKIITAVGRLSHEKGIDVLIRSISALRSTGWDNVLATIVGGGAELAALTQLAKDLGVIEQIRFCGDQNRDQVASWIAAGDVLCLPSRREGCPNVVLEALASGRPVVASRVGGVPELLDESNGIMVPSQDPEALAGGIEQALRREWDPALLRASVESLSWDDVGQWYSKVFADAIEEQQGSKPLAIGTK